MIGYNRRYDPTHQRIKEIVDNKELGKLLRISAHITEPKITDFEYLKVSGGIHRDCVIHDFDMMNFYTGSKAVRVYAKG